MATRLRDVKIPAFIEEIRRGSVSILDGSSLIENLHTRGINVRYIGEIATLAAQNESISRRQIKRADTPEGTYASYLLLPVPLALRELCEIEMIARAVKHILRSLMRYHGGIRSFPGPAIKVLLTPYLVCLTKLQRKTQTPPLLRKKERRPRLRSKRAAALRVKLLAKGAKGIWSEIDRIIRERFGGYRLKLWECVRATATGQDCPENKKTLLRRLSPIALLRRIFASLVAS